ELHVCLGSFILIDKAKKIYSVVLTDITHQMQLQREREALERFANIGKVSRVLAHEVRNPLTNINLAIEGLFEECKETRFHDYFGIIYRNSLRINKLITELLNSTRPTVLEYGKVDIKALLEETLSLAKDRIELQHITIEKNVDDNLPEINGDKKKLIIAFLNIIINAIEAMPKINGLLQINAAVSKNRLMAISITDNGSGMSEEIMEGIFQPFFTQKSNGTGLGLASTQNIILTHKGKVEVKSQLGQGTTFIVYLPLN
ncbi:MAG: GHKL domain-containing protein, partial [Chitinophagaceae bacterium]|nr:GHKL domain-containing protein [Chitinophagaceae bacterium]